MNVQLLLLLALAASTHARIHGDDDQKQIRGKESVRYSLRQLHEVGTVGTVGRKHYSELIVGTEHIMKQLLEGPTVIPTHLDDTAADIITDVTAAPQADLTVITGPPPTEPAAAPEEVATVEVSIVTEEAVVTTEVAATEEVVTEAETPATTFNTEEAAVETEAPAASTAAPEPPVTEAPEVKTEAPTEPEAEVQPTGAAKVETEDEVVVEDRPEEGLSSGQVVGIVIGALLAVVIVIAVVIAVVRRMGKYSSAKNKKAVKKAGVMVSPLRKKSANQQERSKFWKF